MDGSQFDHLTRTLDQRRTRRLATLLFGTALVAPLAAVRDTAGKHKKRKKTCAKKCANGCCTSKYGTCVQLADQSASRCGSGGQICHGGCPECTAERHCPSGKCCKGDGTCGACLVFVTSTPLTGNLGGLTGADAICQSLAGNAGLPGSYMAWLSDNTGSPSTRFTRATAPYTLVDGTIIAANWNTLTTSPLAHAIDKSENGVVSSASPDQVWTNTEPSGVPGGVNGGSLHCQNWSVATTVSGNTGHIPDTMTRWTHYSYTTCINQRRIYCFQQR